MRWADGESGRDPLRVVMCQAITCIRRLDLINARRQAPRFDYAKGPPTVLHDPWNQARRTNVHNAKNNRKYYYGLMLRGAVVDGIARRGPFGAHS